MDNKLIVERKKLRDEIRNNSEYAVKLHNLNIFLATYGDFFKKTDSIEALNRIRNYLSERQVLIDRYNEVIGRIDEIDDQIYECCLHEVCIDISNRHFFCPICETRFSKLKIINSHHIMLKSQNLNNDSCSDARNYNNGTQKNKTEVNIIQDVIYEIASQDKDIFDSFEEYYIKNKKIKVNIKNNM